MVRRGLSPLEGRAVESDVAGLRVLLRRNAQQRPPAPHRKAIERFVDGAVVRHLAEIEFQYFPQSAETA